MLNPDYEAQRLEFYRQRDGVDGAVSAATQMIKVYRAACKSLRAKYGRNFPFRRGYIESAYSARHLLRTKLRSVEVNDAERRPRPEVVDAEDDGVERED
jgi:hypothetical protein